MKISSLKNLIQFLNEEGLRAKKSFSQNFLIDGNILNKIIRAADVKNGEVIVEIGPGPGALTELLLEKGAIVIAIELDKGFSEKLERLQTPDQRLHIIKQDALMIDYDALLSPFLKEGKKAKVVANLPYAITTPILVSLLPHEKLFDKVTVMIQKEVADRLRSEIGKTYGSLSVFVRIYSKVFYEFTVEPTCFFPKPKVRSAVVSFALRPPPNEVDLVSFFVFLRKSFNQRRKMMTTIFKGILPKEVLIQALEAIGLKATARAEEISPDNFIILFKKLEFCPLFSKIEPEEG